MKMVHFFALLLFLFAPFAFGQENKPLPPFIHNSGLVINPKDPAIVYASFWIYGVYKSTDYGKTWRPINKGFKNTSVYNLVINPQDPNVLFAGTHAGGIYKTTDGGENWVEINTGLTTSTVWDLALDPDSLQGLYAITSVGLFKTEDGGKHWTLLPGGVPGPPPDQQMTLFMIPSPVLHPSRPFALLLQNGGLLFRWIGATPPWSSPLLKEITKIRAKPFAFDPKTGTTYAGTEHGLLKSEDGGTTWVHITSNNTIKLPTWIILHPAQPNTLYIGTDGSGVFRSSDGGKNFQPVREGLRGPTSLKIFGLAIDPKDGRRLYAASHSIGLFRTEDGGEHWMPPEKFPIPTIAELAAITKAAVVASPAKSSPIPPPPPDFTVHCNRCHGWADSLLDSRNDVFWRAAPTPRDWTTTVSRMGHLAGLNDAQKATINAYLNTHFGQKP